MRLNLTVPLELCRRRSPGCCDRGGGHLVNVASLAAVGCRARHDPLRRHQGRPGARQRGAALRAGRLADRRHPGARRRRADRLLAEGEASTSRSTAASNGSAAPSSCPTRPPTSSPPPWSTAYAGDDARCTCRSGRRRSSASWKHLDASSRSSSPASPAALELVRSAPSMALRSRGFLSCRAGGAGAPPALQSGRLGATRAAAQGQTGGTPCLRQGRCDLLRGVGPERLPDDVRGSRPGR